MFVSNVVILRRLESLEQCKNPAETLLNVSWKSPGNLIGWICRLRENAGALLWMIVNSSVECIMFYRETVCHVPSRVHQRVPTAVTRAWHHVMPGWSVLRCRARWKSRCTVNVAAVKNAFSVCKVPAAAARTPSTARLQHKPSLPGSGKNSPSTSPFSRKN